MSFLVTLLPLNKLVNMPCPVDKSRPIVLNDLLKIPILFISPFKSLLKVLNIVL